MKKLIYIIFSLLICLSSFTENVYADEYIETFDLEGEFTFLDANYAFDPGYSPDYEYSESTRFLFAENGNCNYYYNNTFYDLYTYPGEEIADSSELPFNVDIVVAQVTFSANDPSKPFTDSTAVTLDGVTLNKIDSSNFVTKETTGITSTNGLAGFYIDNGGMYIHVQTAVEMPDAHYVDSLASTHSGFNYDTYDLDLSAPDGYQMVSKYTILLKGQEVKYVILDSINFPPGIRATSTGAVFDPTSVTDVDSAAVLFFYSPIENGPILKDTTTLSINNQLYFHKDDHEGYAAIIAGEGYSGTYNSGLNYWVRNPDAVDEFLVQFYFGDDTPTPNPNPESNNGDSSSHHIVLNTSVN